MRPVINANQANQAVLIKYRQPAIILRHQFRLPISAKCTSHQSHIDVKAMDGRNDGNKPVQRRVRTAAISQLSP